jgi:hypothetical protein
MYCTITGNHSSRKKTHFCQYSTPTSNACTDEAVPNPHLGAFSTAPKTKGFAGFRRNLWTVQRVRRLRAIQLVRRLRRLPQITLIYLLSLISLSLIFYLLSFIFYLLSFIYLLFILSSIRHRPWQAEYRHAAALRARRGRHTWRAQPPHDGILPVPADSSARTGDRFHERMKTRRVFAPRRGTPEPAPAGIKTQPGFFPIHLIYLCRCVILGSINYISKE